MSDDRIYQTPALSWGEFEAVVARIQSSPPWRWTLDKNKDGASNFSSFIHKGPLSDINGLFQDLSLYKFSLECKIPKREQSIENYQKILKVCSSFKEYLHYVRLVVYFEEKGAILPRKKKARIEIGFTQGESTFGYEFSPFFDSKDQWNYRKMILEDMISCFSLPLKIGTIWNNPGLVSPSEKYVYQYPGGGYTTMFRCSIAPEITIDRMLEMVQEALDRYSVGKVLSYEWHWATHDLEIMAKEPQWPSGLKVSEQIRAMWNRIITQELPAEQFEVDFNYRIQTFEHIKRIMETPNLKVTLCFPIASLSYMDPDREEMMSAGLYFHYNKKGNIYLQLDMPSLFNPREYIRMLGVDFKLL